jgi:hypothetical protein
MGVDIAFGTQGIASDQLGDGTAVGSHSVRHRGPCRCSGTSAKNVFVTHSDTSRDERTALFERIVEVYEANIERLARAVLDKMGAPTQLAV